LVHFHRFSGFDLGGASSSSAESDAAREREACKKGIRTIDGGFPGECCIRHLRHAKANHRLGNRFAA
jgi:hypothetical protein